MAVSQYSDKSTWELFLYGSEDGTVPSSLVVVRIAHANAELFEDVHDACAILACATVRNVVIDWTYTVRMVQNAFCKVGL